MTEKKPRKITMFIQIHLNNDYEIRKLLPSKTCEKELTDFLKKFTTAKNEGSLLEVAHSEMAGCIGFEEKHYFDNTIYVNPDQIAYLKIDADIFPVITSEERSKTDKKLVELIKKGELTFEDQD